MSKRYREYAIPSPREIGTDKPDYLFIHTFVHIRKLYVHDSWERLHSNAPRTCDTNM